MPTLLNVTSEYIDKQGLNINVVFKPFPPLTLHAQQTMATCPVALVHKQDKARGNTSGNWKHFFFVKLFVNDHEIEGCPQEGKAFVCYKNVNNDL